MAKGLFSTAPRLTGNMRRCISISGKGGSAYDVESVFMTRLDSPDTKPVAHSFLNPAVSFEQVRDFKHSIGADAFWNTAPIDTGMQRLQKGIDDRYTTGEAGVSRVSSAVFGKGLCLDAPIYLDGDCSKLHLDITVSYGKESATLPIYFYQDSDKMTSSASAAALYFSTWFAKAATMKNAEFITKSHSVIYGIDTENECTSESHNYASCVFDGTSRLDIENDSLICNEFMHAGIIDAKITNIAVFFDLSDILHTVPDDYTACTVSAVWKNGSEKLTYGYIDTDYYMTYYPEPNYIDGVIHFNTSKTADDNMLKAKSEYLADIDKSLRANNKVCKWALTGFSQNGIDDNAGNSNSGNPYIINQTQVSASVPYVLNASSAFGIDFMLNNFYSDTDMAEYKNGAMTNNNMYLNWIPTGTITGTLNSNRRVILNNIIYDFSSPLYSSVAAGSTVTMNISDGKIGKKTAVASYPFNINDLSKEKPGLEIYIDDKNQIALTVYLDNSCKIFSSGYTERYITNNNKNQKQFALSNLVCHNDVSEIVFPECVQMTSELFYNSADGNMYTYPANFNLYRYMGTIDPVINAHFNAGDYFGKMHNYWRSLRTEESMVFVLDTMLDQTDIDPAESRVEGKYIDKQGNEPTEKPVPFEYKWFTASCVRYLPESITFNVTTSSTSRLTLDTESVAEAAKVKIAEGLKDTDYTDCADVINDIYSHYSVIECMFKTDGLSATVTIKN